MQLKQILDNVLLYRGEEPAATYVSNPETRYKKMVAFANASVNDYLGVHDWQQLKRQHTITNPSDGLHPLPDDFLRLVADTAWRDRYPADILAGDALVVRARQIGGWVPIVGRLVGGQLELRGVRGASEITFDYISKWPINNFTQGQFSSDTDNWEMDNDLLERYIRMRYSVASGESPDLAAEEIAGRLRQLITAESPARTINIAEDDIYRQWLPVNY